MAESTGRPTDSPRDAEAAVTLLFRTHRMELIRLALLLVDDQATAEDVVQDAFLQLHRRWFFIRDQAKALPYLRAAVLNGSRSKLRRRRTERAHRPELAVSSPSAEKTALWRDSHREVVEALRTLSRRQREVLVLRYYLDLSEKEIAATLGIGQGSVKSHASRGLASLAAILGASDE